MGGISTILYSVLLIFFLTAKAAESLALYVNVDRLDVRSTPVSGSVALEQKAGTG
jgi:hypothetical protein